MSILIAILIYTLAFAACYGVGILLLHFVDWVWNTWSDWVLARLEKEKE